MLDLAGPVSVVHGFPLSVALHRLHALDELAPSKKRANSGAPLFPSRINKRP
jgi:hypothetical protein